MANYWKKKSSGKKSSRPPKTANFAQRVKWYGRRRRQEPSTVVPYEIRKMLDKGGGHE